MHYTEPQIDLGLTYFAILGSASKAVKACQHDDPEAYASLGPATITDWAEKRHVARFEEIRKDLAPKVRERLALAADQLATRQAEAEMKAVDLLFDRIAQADVKDLSIAVRNLSGAKGQNINNAQLLRDRPTKIHRTESETELWARLRRIAPNAFVEGEAKEEAAEATPSLPPAA